MRIGGSSGGGGGAFERPSAGERLFEGRMPNPIVGIAGLHGEGPRAAAVDPFGGVYATRDQRQLGPIQSGLGFPRRLAGSALGAFFGSTHHGGGSGRPVQRADNLNLDLRTPIPAHVVGFSFVEAGQPLVHVYDALNRVHVFPVDVADGGDAEKIAEIQLGGPRILVGATAPDGSASAVVREDGLLEVRDAATWSPVATLSLVQKDAPLDPEGVVLAFSRDSSRLAFGMGRLVTTFWIPRRTSTASRA